MSKNREMALLEGPVRGTLLRFAIPIILSMVTTQLYTVADAMIVGLCLNADALAAVSNASSVMMIFLFVSGGLELGGSLLAASSRPNIDQEGMSCLTYNILFVDLSASLLMFILGFMGIDWLLKLIHTPVEIIDSAAAYGRIYLLGLPFMMLYDLSRQLVIGCGESKVPLWVVAVTSLLNIILDLVLVGPLGVVGAAAASSLAQLAGCLYMLRYIRWTMLTGRFRLDQLQWKWLVEVMHLSVPNMIQQSAGTAITVVRQSLLGPLGVAAIAGFSSASKLSSLLLMPVYGLMQSLVVFIAQNQAIGQLERETKGIQEAQRILFIYTALVISICTLGSQMLLGFFTRDEQAIIYGVILLSRECWSYPFTNLRHLQEARLRGRRQMGRYLTSSILSISVNMIGCFVLVPHIGYSGFYMATYIAAPFGLVLAGILVHLHQDGAKNEMG